MGAGILPVAIKNKKLYFLLGKENELDESQKWSDFGGGHEGNENKFQTAIREGGEELNGLLGYGKKLQKLVRKNKIFKIRHKKYVSYLFQIDYDKNLPEYYKNNYEFFSEYLPNIKYNMKNGLLEKDKIEWFTFDDLKNRENDFREFYKNIVDKILKNKKVITENINKVEKYTKKKKHQLRKKRKTLKGGMDFLDIDEINKPITKNYPWKTNALSPKGAREIIDNEEKKKILSNYDPTYRFTKEIDNDTNIDNLLIIEKPLDTDFKERIKMPDAVVYDVYDINECNKMQSNECEEIVQLKDNKVSKMIANTNPFKKRNISEKNKVTKVLSPQSITQIN